MKLVTAEEMRRLDRAATERFGIPSLLLMEHAAIGVTREIERRYGDLAGRRVLILAGKGRNGGDGLAVGRLLLRRGARVEALLVFGREGLRGDAGLQVTMAEQHGIPLRDLSKKNDPAGALEQADVVVDAIFGTGLSAPVTGTAAEAIEAANRSGKPVVAVDLPSGIHADTGAILGAAVRAALTVTLGLPKRGLYLHPGSEYAGVVTVADIGIPPEAVLAESIAVSLIEPEEARAWLPPRPANAHKGTFGHVLVAAGSLGKTGAAAMTSVACLRSGAGLATLALPASLNAAMEQKLTEVMTLPLPETKGQSVSLEAEPLILRALEGKAALAIGPGLSTDPQTQDLVRRLLPMLRIPTVVDADALNALAGHLDVLNAARAPLILTPHPGEMARLCGTTAEEVQRDRMGAAERLARTYRVWVVLKGAHTVVASPDGALRVVPIASSALATAGAGDVLTGVIAGLLAQGAAPFDAAAAGSYLHAMAGTIVAEARGPVGVLAGDLLEALPRATRSLGRRKGR